MNKVFTSRFLAPRAALVTAVCMLLGASPALAP